MGLEIYLSGFPGRIFIPARFGIRPGTSRGKSPPLAIAFVGGFGALNPPGRLGL